MVSNKTVYGDTQIITMKNVTKKKCGDERGDSEKLW